MKLKRITPALAFLLLLTANVFNSNAQVQGKNELNLTDISKISVLREQYVRDGIPYREATQRAKDVIMEQQKVSTRSTARNATPAPGSIWVDRDATGANYSQYHNYTPEDFIKKIFVKDADKMGSAIDDVIKNVKFTGSGWDKTTNTWTADDRALHYFDHGDVTSTVHGLGHDLSDSIMPRFGIEKGFLLATGPALSSEGLNQDNAGLDEGVIISATEVADPDLKGTITQTLKTQTILEFDFKPYVDSVTFKYVFASTEYKNYSNTQFNDAFGFFVSGNNLRDEWGNTGSTINIARYPNGEAICVNSSNWGKRGNNYYQGYDMQGATPVSGPVSYPAPDNSEKAVNPQYHFPVYQSGRTERGGVVQYIDCDTTLMEYDGHSIVLTAKVKLNMGEWYHIKLAIGNAGDDGLGSGAYIMAGSFDLGYSSISSVSEYMTNSMFNLLGGGTNDASDLGYPLPGHVINYFINDPDNVGLTLDDTAKYAGHLYEGCPRSAEIKFVGSNQNMVLYTIDNKWDKYLKIDDIFVEGKRIEKCIKAGTGEEADMSDYEIGDTILYDFTNKKAEIYYSLDSFPASENGANGNVSLVGLAYKMLLGSGTGDTLYFNGYSRVSTEAKYSPLTDDTPGYLSLGLYGGSKYIRWRSIDGMDCDPEKDDNCRWRFLRDTVTGEELPYSKMELRNISNGGDSVPIIIQEPNSCWIDTVWVKNFMVNDPISIQRYVEIPYETDIKTVPNAGKHYVEGHKDFTFYSKYNGTPLKVQAIGYYSKDTISLNGVYQEDGLHEGAYKYVIRQVTQPWTIKFMTSSSGETTNEIINKNDNVWTNGNTLYIDSENGIANIYNLAGVLQKHVAVSGTERLQLPRGFYIVTLNNRQYKVMIK